MDQYPLSEIRSRVARRPWVPCLCALTVCALLVANWATPVGIRFQEQSLDAPVLFGTLSVLSAYALVAGRQIRATWLRLLLRSLGALILVLAVPVGCTGIVFRVGALSVAHISVGSDRVVTYWMSGGAVGPHFTEFRQERSVAPGLVLARVLGDSPYIGDVTLAVVSGNTLRAEVAEGGKTGLRDLFECRVPPLLPW